MNESTIRNDSEESTISFFAKMHGFYNNKKSYYLIYLRNEMNDIKGGTLLGKL